MYFLGTLDVVIRGLWGDWPDAWGCLGQGVECGLNLVGVVCCIICWSLELISWGGGCFEWLGVLLGRVDWHVCRCDGAGRSGAMEL